MHFESEIFTNSKLMEETALKLVSLIEDEKPSILVTETTPFLNILTHLVAHKLEIDWITISFDLGILRASLEITSARKIAYLTTQDSQSGPLTSIRDYLGIKSSEVIFISISQDEVAKNTLDCKVFKI